MWWVVKSLDSLVHGLLLEVGEQLSEVRAGNGQTCQYTVASLRLKTETSSRADAVLVSRQEARSW